MALPGNHRSELAEAYDPKSEMGQLHAHFADWRANPVLRIEDLEEKLERMFGDIPLFPDQFVYVVNYTEGTVPYSRGVQEVLGYPPGAVDMDWVLNSWHPDDAPIVAKLSETMLRFAIAKRPLPKPFEMSVMLDYRVRKADGNYIKVLRQSSIFSIDEATGGMISSFSICKDISHIKTSDQVGWQLAGPAAAEVDMRALGELRPHLRYRPSPREMEVVHMLAQGKSSARIAEELFISKHTVDTHRRNLLDRTGIRNTAELMRMASEAGWI